ncbi:MAG: nitronate monooxygenase [Proteobacteria bacterium]|nr:nitronate monooxygenase [Pseudomonadota bacterium]
MNDATVTLTSAPGGGLPRVIQGGMGVGISGWQLAGAVARTGQLGVVSGTALEVVYARQLQLGDPGGHLRRALGRFPAPAMATRVLERYFVAEGQAPTEPFKGVPMYGMQPTRALQELSVVANFAEVTLAKEQGQGGLIGINFLFKIQLPLLASLYGAMLAGVDFVIIGAGSPAPIGAVLTKLARNEDVSLDLKVQYAAPADDFRVRFSPTELFDAGTPPPRRPRFLAIVSSVELATHLAQAIEVPPEGFVIERSTAGGHNAPPRGRRQFDAAGQPVYGPDDEIDLAQVAKLGRPFWVGGGCASREALEHALAVGAAGIQVGTAFAFCEESGLDQHLKGETLRRVLAGEACVFTDAHASPTGFPFKVLDLPQTLSEAEVYQQRRRICDVGYLRTPFKAEGGTIGYRCAAESDRTFELKRGRPEQAQGRKCLCNALLANVGLGQRRNGYAEPPLVTAGDDLAGLLRFLPRGQSSYSAASVIAQLTGS